MVRTLAHLQPAPPRGDWRSRLFVGYSRAADHPGKLRLERWLRRILRLDEVAATSATGVRFHLVARDYVQRDIIRLGAYEPKSLALVCKLLRPGDTMVDVGGHIGQYALHAGQVVGPTGRVISFEPNPRTHQYLLRNLGLNGYDWVTPVLAAVDTTVGVIRMTFGAEDNWGGARHVEASGERTYFAVALPLSTSLAALGVERVDVLKIDVEGLEPRVLASIGLDGPLRPRHILFEYLADHLRAQGSGEDPVAMLRRAGYEVSDIHGQPLREGEETEEFNVWARDARAPARG